ncbi:phosphoesterase [Priestia megaterium]|uniref:Phosphoesterase n=1 Tax=Priestia megaterium TaxID=1404 RepID=A0AA86LV47_PRIMG|nr:metallophosphoesterase [Priestia megaterium]AXI31230.1 phosphoesterase [Priestia megaterium]
MVIFFIILALGIGLLIFMFSEAHRTYVEERTIYLSTFPENQQPLRLFFISDIHKRTVSSKLLGKIPGEVDFVIIGGDLLEGGVPLLRARQNIQKLKTLGPVYFVWGNNDYEVSQIQLKQMLKDEGVIALKNEHVIAVSKHGTTCNFAGVDDLSEGEMNLKRAVSSIEPEQLTILLSHNPDVIYYVDEESKVDLILSGHTHGGQIRLFNFGMYELGGLKEKRQIPLFVSNGYGTTSLSLRLQARAQTHYITLKRKE